MSTRTQIAIALTLFVLLVWAFLRIDTLEKRVESLSGVLQGLERDVNQQEVLQGCDSPNGCVAYEVQP